MNLMHDILMSSQPYQSQLLGYRRKLHPEESGQLPECFVDLESEDLLVVGAPQFEGSSYENGIKVVSGRLCASCITVVCTSLSGQSTLVPRPCPAFCHFYRIASDGKLGVAWERG